MVTLYTAIGTYKINIKGLPTIITGDTEYVLEAHELLLWNCLAFRILTYKELRNLFYEQTKELHIMIETDFDYYLNRLMNKRLIASGQDYTGIDALYDLLGHLHIKKLPDNFFIKLSAFIKLWIFRRFSFQKAASIFHTEKLEPLEKQVLSLIKHQTLSASELIMCIENKKESLKNTSELMECLYADENTDYASIIIDGRTSETRFSVLATIANLYLQQHIVFQII